MTARNAVCIVNNQVVEFPTGDAHQLSTGGTGVSAASAADLLAKLGAAASGSNGDITQLSGLTSAGLTALLASLGFGSSFGTSGQLVIPSNQSGKKMYLQWGVATPPSAQSVNVPFPSAFPNAFVGGFVCANAQASTLFAGQVYGGTTSSMNVTMFSVGSSSGSALSGIQFYWFALGY